MSSKVEGTIVLIPQFVDRGGYTVYHVHETDPACRTVRAGKMVGLMRFDGTEINDFERIEQLEIDMPKAKKVTE